MKFFRVKAKKEPGPRNYLRYCGQWELCTIQETESGGIFAESDIKTAVEGAGHAFKYCNMGIGREEIK